MAIRKIARLGEPVLRQAAAAVSLEDLKSDWLARLIQDMIDTLRDAEGVGLAAPQVFESWQICVVEVANNSRYPDFEEIPLQVLINPRLTPLAENHDVLVEADAIALYEGCLSIPEIHGRVTRPRSVRVQALSAKGEVIDVVWSGVPAAIVQHEVDHLLGVLFVDRTNPKTLSFRKEYDRHVPYAERCVDGV